MANCTIVYGDNLEILRDIKSSSVDLIYIDPPYNTGKMQRRGKLAYNDMYNDFLGFMRPRLEQAHRILKWEGSLFVHLDYREVHYVKVALDSIFGRECFQNEIIWAYDYGARTKVRWPTKHDTILWYSKTDTYCFNYDAIDRIPYMAPGLVGKTKAELGKTPTDVWWNTIVHTTGKEKTGYPTQKPVNILKRIVRVHSNPGDLLLDFFAGSGSFGEAALSEGRNVILVDANPQAIDVMKRRLRPFNPQD